MVGSEIQENLRQTSALVMRRSVITGAVLNKRLSQ